jgi:hypothetical protein
VITQWESNSFGSLDFANLAHDAEFPGRDSWSESDWISLSFRTLRQLHRKFPPPLKSFSSSTSHTLSNSSCCQVGSHYKEPVFPIWVVCSESHFTVLFSQQRNLLSNWWVALKPLQKNSSPRIKKSSTVGVYYCMLVSFLQGTWKEVWSLLLRRSGKPRWGDSPHRWWKINRVIS